MIREKSRSIEKADPKRHAVRLSRLRIEMQTEGLEALLITHLPNIFYLTGFTGSNASLLVTSSGARLFTDPRYTLQAEQEVTSAKVRITRGSLLKATGECSRRPGLRHAGYEAERLSVAQAAILKEASGDRVRWKGWDGRIERLRSVKDRDELASMREAGKIACAAWEETIPLVHPGVREIDLAAEIDYRMRRKGAAGPAFETIIASGKRSAWPHARPSAKPIGKNELVVFDLGAILRGYSSDVTRTVFVGRASAEVRRWYRGVLEAQEAARQAAKPGVSACSVDLAARKILQRYGLAAKFTHSTGHGLGIEVHEYPRIGEGQKSRLETGMVFTVEPGVYIEGRGGIRIEDDALVTESGAEWITNANRELMEIE